MAFTTICVIIWVVGFMYLTVKKDEVVFALIALVGGLILCFILVGVMKPSLEEVGWETIESYEISYKTDFDNTPVFAEFEFDTLKLYKKDESSIDEITSFNITTRGEVATYKTFKKYAKGNFFLFDNEITRTEISIPIDLAKEWKEK